MPEDLLKFGMIPEFIGRLPVITSVRNLDQDALVRILTEPRNALVKQYERLFELDGVELEFTDDALESMADQAILRGTGARGLRAIMEEVLLSVMYEVPSRKDVARVVITREVVLEHVNPTLVPREIAQARAPREVRLARAHGRTPPARPGPSPGPGHWASHASSVTCATVAGSGGVSAIPRTKTARRQKPCTHMVTPTPLGCLRRLGVAGASPSCSLFVQVARRSGSEPGSGAVAAAAHGDEHVAAALAVRVERRPWPCRRRRARR